MLRPRGSPFVFVNWYGFRRLSGPKPPPSGGRRRPPKKFVELDSDIEHEKRLRATDMRAVDEDLRNGASTQSFCHGLPVTRIRLDIEFLPLHALLLEEHLRPSAERAPVRNVHLHISCHIASPDRWKRIAVMALISDHARLRSATVRKPPSAQMLMIPRGPGGVAQSSFTACLMSRAPVAPDG